MPAASVLFYALEERVKTGLASVRALFRKRAEIYQDAYEGRQFNMLYFAMLVFACLIALLGLLLNSPAVIIGAMLISPLMGPILACGLALTLADWDLGRKAAKNVLLSVGETILITTLATWLSPLREVTPEILARSTPNLMDLLIAFFSGFAGTLALASRKGGLTILPGVAIATAVMPPLATVGYGLSTRQWNVAGGAFMLFFTNFTAIVISADLVFLLIGFRPKQVQIAEQPSFFVRWRIAIAGVVLLGLSIPLMRTLLRAAHQSRIHKEIAVVLHQQFDKPGMRRMAGIAIKAGQSPILVDSVVQTESFIEPAEINNAEDACSTKLGVPVRLIVEQVQLAHPTDAPKPLADGRDLVAGGVVRPGAGVEFVESPSESLARLQDRIKSVVEPLMRPAGVADLTITGLTSDAGSLRIQLAGRQSETTDPQAWKVVCVVLGKELKSSVTISSILALEGSGSYDIHFRENSSQIPLVDRHKILALLAQWKNKAGIKTGLIVPSSLPAQLRDQRIVALKRIVGNEATQSSDTSLDENIVRVQILQILKTDSEGPAPSKED